MILANPFFTSCLVFKTANPILSSMMLLRLCLVRHSKEFWASVDRFKKHLHCHKPCMEPDYNFLKEHESPFQTYMFRFRFDFFDFLEYLHCTRNLYILCSTPHGQQTNGHPKTMHPPSNLPSTLPEVASIPSASFPGPIPR